MYNHHLYLLYWFVNGVVLYLFAGAFPSIVVLGSGRLTPIESAFYAAFWMTFVVWTMWDLVVMRKIKLEPKIVSFGYFLLVNFLGVWLVSKYGGLTGLKVMSWQWILLLGVAANIFQRLAWKITIERQRS